MKNKFRWVLGLLVCLLVFPMLVRADVGMPEIKPYDVIVTNKDGIELVDSYSKKSITIPYDTKLTVNMEYYDSNKKVYYGYIQYNGLSGDIDLSNVRIASEKVNLKDFAKLDNPVKIYTIDEVEMYKGPSKMYGRVEGDKTIPKGTTLSYEYYDEIWAYVEYDGVKGWIVKYPYGNLYSDLKTSIAYLAPKGKNRILVTENINKLLVSPNGDEKVSVNIPKDTVLEYEYTFKALRSEYLYVEYNGTKGWLLITNYMGPYSAAGLVENECSSIYIISDNAYIYSKREDLSSKTNKKVEKGTEARIIYSYFLENESWYYISYNDEEVWLMIPSTEKEDKVLIAENYGSVQGYKATEDIDVYEFPSKDAKKISSLRKDTEIYSYYDYIDYSLDYRDDYHSWSYIKTENISGWVLDKKITRLENNFKQICSIVNSASEEEEEKETEEKNENVESKKMTPAQMAIIGVGGAVVLALVVIVTITIINKKKKIKE